MTSQSDRKKESERGGQSDQINASRAREGIGGPSTETTTTRRTAKRNRKRCVPHKLPEAAGLRTLHYSTGATVM